MKIKSKRFAIILFGVALTCFNSKSHAKSDEGHRAACAVVQALNMIKLKKVKRVEPADEKSKSKEKERIEIIQDGEEVYDLGTDVVLAAFGSSFSSVVNECYPLVKLKIGAPDRYAKHCKIFEKLTDDQLDRLNQAAIATINNNSQNVTDSINSFTRCEEKLIPEPPPEWKEAIQIAGCYCMHLRHIADPDEKLGGKHLSTSVPCRLRLDEKTDAERDLYFQEALVIRENVLQDPRYFNLKKTPRTCELVDKDGKDGKVIKVLMKTLDW